MNDVQQWDENFWASPSEHLRADGKSSRLEAENEFVVVREEHMRSYCKAWVGSSLRKQSSVQQ